MYTFKKFIYIMRQWKFCGIILLYHKSFKLLVNVCSRVFTTFPQFPTFPQIQLSSSCKLYFSILPCASSAALRIDVVVANTDAFVDLTSSLLEMLLHLGALVVQLPPNLFILFSHLMGYTNTIIDQCNSNFWGSSWKVSFDLDNISNSCCFMSLYSWWL